MCIIFFAYKSHPQYKLILAANRDEFYERPTKTADLWEDYPDILGGRDLEKMGTWMAIDKQGRFGAVTNYRDFSLHKKESLSRGNLVKDYLTNNKDIKDYLKEIKDNKDKYNPFNLILGDEKNLYYYCNVENDIKKIQSGIYGLSNHLLDTPWPKISRGKEIFKSIIKHSKEIEIDMLFNMLRDDIRAKDSELPNTGVGTEWERILSPIFIKSPNYGTRASTVLLVENSGKVIFVEKSLVDSQLDKWRKTSHIFRISK